jgi:Probable zinc-ribbon domain
MTQEKVMTCVGCGNSYTLTAGEQSFFMARQWNFPKRCKGCRAIKKAQRQADAAWAQRTTEATALTYDATKVMEAEPARCTPGAEGR